MSSSGLVIGLLVVAILAGLTAIAVIWPMRHLKAEGEQTTTFLAVRPGHRKPRDYDALYHRVEAAWDRVFEWIGQRWQWPGSSVR